MLKYEENSMIGKASDYTLFVGGLPTDIKEDELREYIESTGSEIHAKPIEISCIYDMHKVYQLYDDKIYIETELTIAKHNNIVQKYYFNPFLWLTGKKPLVRTVATLQKRLTNIMKLLKFYEAQDFHRYKRTKYAFITFNTIAERKKYRKLIKARAPLKVLTYTPEPSEVIWKNICYPKYKRNLLTFVSFASVILMIGFCTVINILLTLLQVYA